MRYWQAMVTAGLSAALMQSSSVDRGFLAHAIANVLIGIAFGILWLFLKFTIGPRDSDVSSAEDAKRLSPEGVAARAEGIAP